MHNLIYDPARNRWVKKTPEELMRQRLIQVMVHQLGYPLSLIAVEKELMILAQNPRAPKRRVDIVVFANHEAKLEPLLIVECKAVPLTEQFFRQVIGYNAFIRAPYVALANEQAVMTGAYNQETGELFFTEGLPTYQALNNRRVLDKTP